MRSEIEAEIESLLVSDTASEVMQNKKPETSNDRKPCGCAIRGRSKASCLTCNPAGDDDQEDEPQDEDEEKPEDKVCECGGVKRHKRDCPNRGNPTITYADEQLQPLKRYKCIECGREIKSRQHRLDLTCAAPCYNKTLVEVFEPK